MRSEVKFHAIRDANQTVPSARSASARTATLHATEMRSAPSALVARGSTACGMYPGKIHIVPGTGLTGR